MKKKTSILILSTFFVIAILAGCGRTKETQSMQNTDSNTHETQSIQNMSSNNNENVQGEEATMVIPTEQEIQLEEGLSAVLYQGDYGFDDFLKQGGASSDKQVIGFLSRNLISGAAELSFESNGFGCSTLSVSSKEGDALFGRNFDWQACNALVVESIPKNGYKSISTVNMDFLNTYGNILQKLPTKMRTNVALYAPLDGMNEKGLCAAVLMIEDSAIINQNTEKPDITTTAAIRLLLDKAANLDEALALLKEYDMHSSMGMMVHFALSDANGRSVVVEYVNNEMIVNETPAVTNFYLAEGEKNGIGTSQSHTRYDILMKQLDNTPTMGMDEVRDAMDSVSKDNFGEFESTEWSIVYNKTKGEVRYYHRENYGHSYVFNLAK